MGIEVLDPTYGDGHDPFTLAPRLASLQGKTIGVVSNGKQGTGRFFDAFAEHLHTHYDVAGVERVVKPNYSAPAGDAIMHDAAKWHAVVSGIGD